MDGEILIALNQLERERGISVDDLVDALEVALVSAYRKHTGAAENVRVHFDRGTGAIRVVSLREVVENVSDPATQISLPEALDRNPGYKLGDFVEDEITAKGFGRIAAQTAKQVVMQKLREKERGMIYEEFAEREGDVVTGQVVRVERGVVMWTSAGGGFILPQEQVRGEKYNERDREGVRFGSKEDPERAPDLAFPHASWPLEEAFRVGGSEIRDGVVEIRGIAREAGMRSKVAVRAVLPEVDPLGACVAEGRQSSGLSQELKGERIDVIEWSDDSYFCRQRP